MDALLLLFPRANMTCNQHQHSIHAYELLFSSKNLHFLKVCMRQFHDIWHLSIYGINLWFFETFREGPWCLFHYNLSGSWAIIMHQMGDVSTFQPLTSMIQWKTPGLYIDVILFSWRDAGWEQPFFMSSFEEEDVAPWLSFGSMDHHTKG